MKRTAPEAALVFAFVLGCAGCALNRADSKDFYRLSAINSQPFVLAPVAKNDSTDEQKIQFSIRSPGTDSIDIARADCTINGAWFSLSVSQSKGKTQWIMGVPRSDAWEKNEGSVNFQSEWVRFVRQLHERAQSGCFGGRSEQFKVEEQIEQQMSVPTSEVLFFRYSFGRGGYVDLNPEIQLRIERASLLPPSQEIGATLGYQGTRTAYYDIVSDETGGIALKLTHLETTPNYPKQDHDDSPDLKLASIFAARPYVRLFLLNLTTAVQTKTPALLIGFSKIDDLTAATELIELNPGISCDRVRIPDVTCASFDGVVNVSPLIRVRVNGHWKRLPLGSSAQSAFPLRASSAERLAAVKGMKIRRLFHGRYVDFDFDRGLDSLNLIQFVAGDEVSWPKEAIR